MKHNTPHIVQVSREGEQALALAVIVHPDLAIVAARRKQWLRRMEGTRSHRSVMVLVLVQHALQLIVPQLHLPVMEGDQDQCALRVEGNAFDARAFVFKLDQHPSLLIMYDQGVKW